MKKIYVGYNNKARLIYSDSHNLISKTITQGGTYNAVDDGAYGYSIIIADLDTDSRIPVDPNPEPTDSGAVWITTE